MNKEIWFIIYLLFIIIIIYFMICTFIIPFNLLYNKISILNKYINIIYGTWKKFFNFLFLWQFNTFKIYVS